MAASMKIAVFWVVAQCGLVQVYRRSRDACCLRYQGYESSPWWWREKAPLKRRSTSIRLHGATTQKAAIFRDQVVRPESSFLFVTVIPKYLKFVDIDLHAGDDICTYRPRHN
jgi:hypothetical protein